MGYCTKCGKPLADGAKFCVNCGNPVGGQAPAAQPQQMQPSNGYYGGGDGWGMSQQPQQAPKGKLSMGALIGIIAGAVVVSAALGFGAYTIVSNILQDKALEAEEEFDDIDDFDDDDDLDDFADEEYDDLDSDDTYDNDYDSGSDAVTVPESFDEPEVAEEYDDDDYDDFDYDEFDEGYPEEETGYGDPEYVFYDSDSRYLEDSEVENTLPRIYIWFAKNEIYARHGRIFKNDILSDYFNSKDWYYGSFDEVYESELNQYEKANIKLLKKYEDKYKDFIEEEKKHYFE